MAPKKNPATQDLGNPQTTGMFTFASWINSGNEREDANVPVTRGSMEKSYD